MNSATVSARSRRLGAALEPVIGQVYFSPECHANYADLGFQPSARTAGGVALPDGPAYFTSRGSVMGQVPGEVVAAAFAVFNPAVVIPSVEFGWTITDARTICTARADGAVAQLRRVLGPHPAGLARVVELLSRCVEPLRPEGRPLFAGVRAQPEPEEPLAAMWWMGDMLREFRGDSHTSAWTAIGLDATEIGLLTELYWGLPLRSYSRTRAWSDDQFDAAADRLRDRGLLDGDGFSSQGRAVREQIEHNTDAQMRGAIDALGDDCDELLMLLEPWGTTVRAAHGYLPAGPHDLAAAAASPA
jgi:hypothetical protein